MDTTISKLPLYPNGHHLRLSEVEVFKHPRYQVFMVMEHLQCRMCDRAIHYDIKTSHVEVREPCPLPDGVTTTINLSVPSGKLIVTDDLRPVYDWDDIEGVEYASYNSILGQAQAVMAMASIGCAYGPVGNSCPGLYRTGADTLIIASPGYDEDDNPLLPEEGRLAGICTDLWAYSIADFEHWKSRGGDPEKLGWTDKLVDIEPGTYQFTHHSGERDFDPWDNSTTVYAHIQRLN